MINDMGVGLFFQIPEAFQIGLSSSQLLESSAAMQGSSITKLKRHYYLFSDYQYKLPSFTDWSLRPSVFAESDGTATQFSTSLLLENSRHYWIGLAYRNQDAVSVLAGLHYKGLRIAYAYDWTTSSMKKAGSMGSHEIMLNYFIKIERMPARTMYKNARYL